MINIAKKIIPTVNVIAIHIAANAKYSVMQIKVITRIGKAKHNKQNEGFCCTSL